jgi:hypothetical protein
MQVERVVAAWLHLQDCEMSFFKAQADIHWARYWLARRAQADKFYHAAVKSLLLVRALLSAPVSTKAPAIVDVGGPVALPEAKQQGEPPTPAENLTSGAPSVNRIAQWTDPSNPDPDHVETGVPDGKRRVNGYDTGGRIMHAAR